MNLNQRLLNEAKALEARWDTSVLKLDDVYWRPIPKNLFWTQPQTRHSSTIYRNHWLDRVEYRWRAKKVPGAIDANDGVLFGGHMCINCSQRLCNEENNNNDEWVEKAVLNYDKAQYEKKNSKAEEKRGNQKGTGSQTS